MLDVGCGSERLARRLGDAGFEVVGVDASPAMIALAREHAPAGTETNGDEPTSTTGT